MKPSDEVIILKSLYNTNLVYHRRDFTRNRFKDEHRDIRMRLGVTARVWMATRCGVDTHWVQWDTAKDQVVQDGKAGSNGTMIRIEYADLFARPCKKCFPWGPPTY